MKSGLKMFLPAVCLAGLLGCGGEAAPTTQQPDAAVELTAKAEAERAAPAKTLAPRTAERTPAKKDSPRSAKAEKKNPRLAPEKPSRLSASQRGSAARKPPAPEGMDVHADFKGTRIGLLHTGNLIGEVDPCG